MNDLQRQRQPNNLGDGLPADGGINPWWQRWGRNQDWRDEVHEEFTRKGFDLPKHDMQATTNNNNVGIGAKGLVGAIAASSLLPAALIGGFLLTRDQEEKPLPEAPPPVEAPAPVDTDTDTQYEFKTQPGGSQ